ncbi:hypothetical protein GCM10023322_47850 [Rugosimonospora acidiphila]|uniref:Predicted membrane protein YciQ-like C-terminal domain-containing protein n=1 Tax=Rugosimonospora acidiphila TaxID=556531 RepID=A0ABP9S6P8_9ACTN
MSASLFLAAGLAIVSVGVWGVAYLLALLATRPAHPEPAPSTQDLGPEPPAVASLLACGWVLTEDAAEATLIDLAARHYLEFRQPGNDPRQTTVHVRDPRPAGLNRYEQMIFDRVTSLATGGVVPLTALTFRDPAQAKGFRKRVEAAVIADCRKRGLSRRRFGPAALAVLNVLAVVCGFGLAAAVMLMPDSKNAHPSVSVAAGAWLFGAAVLVGIGNRPIGERDTPAGLAACARWLGVKTWLRNTEEFANLPPAAVTVWDRYLAYGAALGATRLASGVIDLGMGNRRRVWSSFGGTWHQLRVRYPNFWPRYGRTARYFIIEGLLVMLGGVLFVRIPGGGVILLAGVLLLCFGLYVLARAIVDVASPVTLTGQVLWREKWRTKSGSDDEAVPWLHYLAVDDGAGDTTTAWGVPSEWVDRCRDGDTVRISVRRWSRRVLSLEVVAASQVPPQEAASPVSGGTEALIAAELGISTIRGAGGAPLPSPEQLLTADEVSRAVGAPVTMRGISNPGSRAMSAGAVVFEGADRRALVSLIMADGTAGKAAMMLNRRNPPLPGIGDEAYGGDRSAVARKDGVVVSLSTRTSPHPVDPRNLHWLLSVAMTRLSPTRTPPGDGNAAGQRAVP